MRATVIPRLVLTLALAAPVVVRAADADLIRAVEQRNDAAVQSALARGESANAKLPDGTTVLHLAVRGNDVVIVRRLVQAGAEVRAINRYGVAPLTEAATNGNADILALLLDAGADPNTTVPQGETVLMTAARTGRADAVRLLLARGARVNDVEQWRGQTALMWAANENHVEAMRVLLENGADLKARSRVTQPPARGRGAAPPPPAAASQAQATQAGAPQTSAPRRAAGGGGGDSPQASPQPAQTVQAAPARQAPPPTGGLTPLLFAVRQGHLDATRALVEAGAPVDEAAPDGTTALQVAILNAHYPVAHYLLEKGADPNRTNYLGAGALYLTVNMRNLEHSARPAPPHLTADASLEMMKALLAKGADANARLTQNFPTRGAFEFSWVDLTGATPFVRAAKSSDVVAMRLLLEHGADPNIATAGGATAFMLASGLGWIDLQSRGTAAESLDAMTLCLEHGADVNAVNAAGQTALIGAAIRGDRVVGQFLLERGAKPNHEDKEGRTALTYAEGVKVSAGAPVRQEAMIALLTEARAAASAQGAVR